MVVKESITAIIFIYWVFKRFLKYKIKQTEAMAYPECSRKLKYDSKKKPSITVEVCEINTNNIPIENQKNLYKKSFFPNIITKKIVTIKLSKRVIISLS